MTATTKTTTKTTTGTRDPDYPRRLLLDEAFLSAELEELAQRRSGPHPVAHDHRAGPQQEAAPGVSVVVATCRGADRLATMMRSLSRQTLPAALFEVVVVCNGPDDGSMELLDRLAGLYPELTVRAVATGEASAGGARNIGLAMARRRFVTMLDDDDELEPRFLATALDHAGEGTVVLLPIVDVSPAGRREERNHLNLRISRLAGRRLPVHEAPWALGFNACKLVETSVARRFTYDPALSSGEDVVYFAHLLTVPGLTLTVPAAAEESAYLRHLSEHSVSRGSDTLDFAVRQRLECVRRLMAIELEDDAAADRARRRLVEAQMAFTARYLQDRPELREEAMEIAADQGLTRAPLHLLNKGLARDLAFLYCFAPYSDSSAVVAAKALVERRRVTDVITATMDGVRRRDPDVRAVVERWLDELVVIETRPSFAGWGDIGAYATQALAAAEERAAVKHYERMYSRALWVGSHVAAALYKLRHWTVRWSAEFSDPMRRDSQGVPRVGPFEDDDVSRRLLAGVRARGFDHELVTSCFDLVELATFVLADELIFTNANQMEYMLADYDDPRLRRLVRSKATVRHHPVPPATAYEAVDADLVLPQGCVNIAYFGSFYPSRGIGEVLVALAGLDETRRRRVRLHVFTNQPDQVREQVAVMGLAPQVHAAPYLPYLVFLNACTRFDVLLVNDVVRDPSMSINPFLPSKYSDYLGSGRAIWGLLDEGSALSAMDLDYRARAGDVVDIRRTLERIVDDLG